MHKETLIASSVGSESAPHCYNSTFAHGFELSRRRKKRPVWTYRNSTYEWAPTSRLPRGVTKGVDPIIKGTFYFYYGVHTLRDPLGYPSGGSPLIGFVSSGPNWPFLSPPLELEPMRKGTP